jgi:hypothetical protein
MKDGEPSAGKLRPTPPSFRQSGQFRRLGEPALDGLMSEIGVREPLGPRIGPPRNICGRGKAPGGGR